MVLTFSHKWGHRLFWWSLFLGSLLPLIWIFYQAWTLNLGADPAEEVTDYTGTWTLRFLLASLAITPLRKLLGWSWLIRYRRMLGLYTAFYALIHLLSFVTFILGWRMDLLWGEVTERPYIIVGSLAFMLLLPLVVTSTKAMQRRLGKRWMQLHRLVYVIALLAMVHFIWQIRSNYLEVLIYGLILSVLLGYRLYLKVKQTYGAGLRRPGAS
ncbi:sulfite oxidase heme-binding subunit YedZ [Pontibacter sp. JAM-7]|uniref:sulfite oxidase heme-binding subunit YedZ n=1 Tax=Pontibacter sp. JAM-7 TaxID=3366581 RepID=UPI003AF534EE